MDIFYAILLAIIPFGWVILQTTSSFLYAVQNFLDEFLLKHIPSLNKVEGEVEGKWDAEGPLVLVSGFFGIVTASVFGVWAILARTSLDIGIELTIIAITVGVFEVVWLIPYFRATAQAGAVNAAPLFQAIPVISLLLGLLAYSLANHLGISWAAKYAELPSTQHIIAAVIIVVGGIWLSLRLADGKRKIDGRTIRLMVLASTIIAVITFLFKDTALESNFVATAFYSGIGMSLAGVGYFVFNGSYRKQFLMFCKNANKKTVVLNLSNEVVDTLAVATSHYAVTIGPSVMAVMALNAWQPVFILIGGKLMAERGSKDHAALLDRSTFTQTAAAIGLLAIGTVLIAL